mgnify:CR=1 FL=1
MNQKKENDMKSTMFAGIVLSLVLFAAMPAAAEQSLERLEDRTRGE